MTDPSLRTRPGTSPGALVIVSGLPAAGKSTLSDRLGTDLGLPVIHRDRLRHYVFDGFHDIEAARPLLPAAGDRLVLGTVATVIEAGIGTVLDGNFNTHRHMTPVRDFVEGTGLQAIEICLWGDPDTLRHRFIERADPPLTEDLKDYFEQVLYRDRTAVLADPDRVRHHDTTDLARFDAEYADLLAWVRTHTG